MTDRPSNKGEGGKNGPIKASERVPPASQNEATGDLSADEIRLADLWNIVWSGKWLIVGVTFVFTLLSVAYAISATEWYRAEVLLAPAEERNATSLQNQLGGLAALTGVSIGSGDSVEAVATLNSREFAREFIEEYGLLTVFFADAWDAGSKRWLVDDPSKEPDIRDAVRYFHEEILRVSEDRATGLVTLAIEWTDPIQAAEWAGMLVDRLNAIMRARALKEAETNVTYLREELAQTNVVTLQQAVGRLLESELQKLMLARGTQEFAFRIIDSAEPPKRRVRPKRALIVIVGTLVGGMVALAWIFLGHAVRS